MNICIYISILLFIATRYFFQFHNNETTIIVVLLVAMLCLYEAIFCICQLFGLCITPSMYYAFTGSFKNPGPLGGFMSICVSLLISYYLFQNNIIVKQICLFVSILTVILLPATGSRTAFLSLFICLLLMALKTKRGNVLLRKHWIPLLFATVTVGMALYVVKKPSADGRFFMNKISMMAMLNNGLFGSGRGHFSGAYGSEQAKYFIGQINQENGFPDLTSINEHERMTAVCPDMAYNDFFQIGVEYGPIMMIIIITIILLSIIHSYKSSNIFCYGLTAIAVFACFSYPLHIVIFKLLLSVFMATCIPYLIHNGKITKVLYLIITIVCVCLIFHEIPKITLVKVTETECNRIMKRYNKEDYNYVVENSPKIVDFKQHDKEFMFAYGRSLNMIGDYEKSDSVLMLCAKISCNPMIWNVMGRNSQALGRYREAEERYKYAFYLVPNRLYPLTLLAKLYHVEGDSARFINLANQIEVFKPKIESFYTELMRQEIQDIRSEYESNYE